MYLFHAQHVQALQTLLNHKSREAFFFRMATAMGYSACNLSQSSASDEAH
jgi:DnaJ-domain-containing protein 1